MASSYVNDLRLNEMATGDASGTWGDTTNTNLELIAEAFSYGTEAITTNADTHTTTIADGATDPGRSMFLKYTGTLDSTCTITIGPNTVSKLWIIENGTSGSQSIIIKQGSGATVTIPSGKTKVIYSDGAGSGGAMVDAFASLNLQTSGIIETSASIQTALIEYTDGDDAMTIADGGQVTFAQNIIGTLGTAAQGNITSLGTLTALTGGTGDLNWDSGTLFVDSSANAVGIGTTSPDGKLHVYQSDASITPDADADDFIIEGNGATGMTIGSSASSVGSIRFADSGSPRAGMIYYNHVGNDMRFYTVATERLRIDSSGNVGIGTSSPARKVQIQDTSSTVYLSLVGPTNAGAGIMFGDSDDETVGRIAYDNSNNSMQVYTNDIERMRIDASGKVGIGTSATDGMLTIKKTGSNLFGDSAITIQSADTDQSTLALGLTGSVAYIDSTESGNGAVLPLAFATGSVEKMRIDSSGNLLVGKTATNTSTVGIEARENGLLVATRDGNQPLLIDRLTDDGDLVLFRKDSTTVGSIGASSGDLTIYSSASGHCGLRFTSGGVAPINNTGSLVANSVDIGQSSWKFRDLYLSGGAYLGGTGAANHLDDYEEGSWTPTFSGATLSQAVGSYTRIGNQVTVSYRIITTGGLPSSGSQVQVGGLPFTISNATINGVASGFGGVGSVYVGPSNVTSAAGGGGTIVSFASGNEAFLRYVVVDQTTLGYLLMGELEVSANNTITAFGTQTYQV